MAAFLTPTAAQTIPLIICMSPDGQFIAIGHRNNVVELFRLVNGTWVSVAVFTERSLYQRNMQYESITAISWHPTIYSDFIIVYTRGTVYSVSFSESGQIRTKAMIDLSRSLKKSTTLYLREVCFDNQATEMSAVFDDKILTFSDPWKGEIERVNAYALDSLYTLIPDGYSNVIFSSYIADHELLLVYPLGIFAVSTSFSPPKLIWSINISRSRMLLPGGALSPDKSKYLGITEYNEVEAYDLHLQRFIAKITHSSGPYRSILMVVYIDRDSAALVHKLPQGDEHHVEIIPRLEIGRANASFCLQIGQTEPDTPRALRVLHPVIGGLIDGKGHLILVKDLSGRVAVICIEDFGIDLRDMRIRVADAVDQSTDAASGQEIPTGPAEANSTLISEPGTPAGLGEAPDPDDTSVFGSTIRGDNVSTHQQVTALIGAHTQDNLQFTAEFTPAIPAPHFHAEPSGAVVHTADDQFVTAFALILYFLVASTTLICYVAVATAILSA